jgi:hypothetical protein
VVFVVERFYVRPIGIEVFRGHDHDLAGQAVAEGVQRRTLFAGFGLGAGGVLGVLLIDLGSIDFRGCHNAILSA